MKTMCYLTDNKIIDVKEIINIITNNSSPTLFDLASLSYITTICGNKQSATVINKHGEFTFRPIICKIK